MTYKAKLLVLEGIDGTGKTTTANKLKEHYEQQGKKVFLYHEPYKFASFDVKEIISNFEAEKKYISDFAILNIMIASRDISVNNILIPALNEYDIVIADRYYYSTYAYQWEIFNEIISLKLPFHRINKNYPAPDKVIFFKVKDLETYQNNQSDNFEIQDLSKFKEIQREYKNAFNTLDSVFEFTESYNPELIIIEVDQNKESYFNFQEVLEVLEALEGI